MITWTITEQQADIIMTALQQRPFYEVANLIGLLVTQAKQNPPADKPESAAQSVTE